MEHQARRVTAPRKRRSVLVAMRTVPATARRKSLQARRNELSRRIARCETAAGAETHALTRVSLGREIDQVRALLAQTEAELGRLRRDRP